MVVKFPWRLQILQLVLSEDSQTIRGDSLVDDPLLVGLDFWEPLKFVLLRHLRVVGGHDDVEVFELGLAHGFVFFVAAS